MLPPHSCHTRLPAAEKAWLSPAELAGYRTFRVSTPGGFRFPILQYPIGCGFVQSMEQPAVWCAATSTPSPDQAGGGLHAPCESLLGSLCTDRLALSNWGNRESSLHFLSDNELPSAPALPLATQPTTGMSHVRNTLGDGAKEAAGLACTEGTADCSSIALQATSRAVEASACQTREQRHEECDHDQPSVGAAAPEHEIAGLVNATTALDVQAAVSLAGPAPLEEGDSMVFRYQRGSSAGDSTVSSTAGQRGPRAADSGKMADLAQGHMHADGESLAPALEAPLLELQVCQMLAATCGSQPSAPTSAFCVQLFQIPYHMPCKDAMAAAYVYNTARECNSLVPVVQ
jgi:hypothetical protein